MKEYRDLTAAQREIWDAAHAEGYDEGWHEGYEAYEVTGGAVSVHYDEGFHAGFKSGTEKEQERVQYILNMMFESSLNMGKGQKAVFYREVMELLKPVDIKDYRPEDEDF